MKDPNWAHRIDWAEVEHERAERCRRILREIAAFNCDLDAQFVKQGRLQSEKPVRESDG